ncbi:alpha/beta fold hydrolase [Micromonospora sp. WMMD714]|uniref:thioesterase II family protein n=1 Tax=Micromonospora sp. WMMD714 TaxID=3016097 RepID=UPI00249BA76C|nr:alpha/beta fold hydrolase [Micromonospora sp. WMMD714]WFE65087.1 alpha/beta fold hydrolase [Micromonospora sp. WMMD714]
MTTNAPTTSWLRRYRPRPAATRRLVCFPFASGNATFYRQWAVRLPADVEVVAVQYPGRLDRIHEPCVTDMDTMVDGIVAALQPLLRDDLTLFGHSMGAAVAYEVAHRLEHGLGLPPRRLIVSGRPAPQHHRPGVKHLGSDEELWDELRRLGGTTDETLAHPELRTALLPTLRADYRLVETYRPTLGAPLSVPVTAITGDDDPEAHVPEVADWRRRTTGEFHLRVLPGHHFYLIDRQAEVLDHLREAFGPTTARPR